jgi:hypothetical protein
MTSIVDYLTTPGSYIVTPSGAVGRVLAFDATTNEVEVDVGAGVAGAPGTLLTLGRRQTEAFENEMRTKGTWRSYHFKNLRPAPSPASAAEHAS